MDAREELKENRDYYFNEAGLLVFTREYHLKRGYCCHNNCQNCPYRQAKMPKTDII